MSMSGGASEEYDESGCHPQGEVELMVESCTALLSSMFGENNWARWNQVKQQTQYYNDFQAFLSWLLDIAESEIISADANNMKSSETPFTMADEGANEQGGLRKHSVDERLPLPTQVTGDMVNYGSDDAAARNGWDARASNTGPFTGSVDIDYNSESCLFYCRSCRVSLSDLPVTSQHLNLCHRGTGDALPCLQIHCSCCLAVYHSIHEYVTYHKQRSSRTPGRPSTNTSGSKIACDYCAKSFSNRFCLKEHVQNKHELPAGLSPEERKGHQCAACGKRFSYASGLSRHRGICQSRAGVTGASAVGERNLLQIQDQTHAALEEQVKHDTHDLLQQQQHM